MGRGVSHIRLAALLVILLFAIGATTAFFQSGNIGTAILVGLVSPIIAAFVVTALAIPFLLFYVVVVYINDWRNEE